MKKLIALFAALAVLSGCKSQPDLDSEYAVDMIPKGESVPELVMPARDGSTFDLSEFRGRYVVLDFWASWCPDCRADVQTMKELYARYGDKATFVGISFDTDPEKLDSYVKENGIGWLQLCEFIPKKESTVGDAYHVKWIPSMYLVDPEGNVVLGTVMIDKLAAALKLL